MMLLEHAVVANDIANDISDDIANDEPGTDPEPIAAGQRYSFEDLCMPAYGDLINFARRLTNGDDATAADIVHDSLEKAMRAWPRFTVADAMAGPAAVARWAKAWLYRIVHNTFCKVFHRRRVRQEMAKNRRADIVQGLHGNACGTSGSRRLGSSATYGPRGPANDSDLSERMQEVVVLDRSQQHSPFWTAPSLDGPFTDEVVSAIEKLSVERRDVINLHYVHGMSCQDIAAELGVPKNTVGTRLARARAELGELLGDYPAREYNLRRVPSGGSS